MLICGQLLLANLGMLWLCAFCCPSTFAVISLNVLARGECMYMLCLDCNHSHCSCGVVCSSQTCNLIDHIACTRQADIACSYTLLNGLSYIAREATKVFLGAAAVLSNGTVMARAGSAAVAMAAAARSTPVVICCETYKFHERVQLDSITHNELGDPDALAALPSGCGVGKRVGSSNGGGPLASWSDVPHLGLLNLKYDAMPADYVTLIATEMGMIPPTSVPVILREHSVARQEGL